MNRFRIIVPFAAFGISILAIQGSIYALQLVSAANVDAFKFGQIRTIESLAAVFALGITFGLPSTLLIHARQSSERGILSLTGGASLISLLLFSLVATLITILVFWWGIVAHDVAWLLATALPLSLLMAVRLVLASAGQAQQRFLELSRIAALASIVSLASFSVAVGFGHANQWSWMAARLLLEVIFIAGMWRISFGTNGISFRPWRAAVFRARFLSRSAMPLGASLFLRSLLDQGPILLASVIVASAAIIAEVGLIVTICTVALVPALTAQGVFVPRLVETAAIKKTMPYQSIFWYLVTGAIGTAVIATILLNVVPLFISWAKAPNVTIMTLTAAIVGAKMMAGAIGGVLLALQRNQSILAINVATACFGICGALVLVTTNGEPSTQDFLTAIAIVEVLGATLYLVALLIDRRTRQLKKQATSRNC